MDIRSSLLLNSSFIVNIGKDSYSFARVRNISAALEVESVREGGDNWHVHTLVKQPSSEQKIVFERGLLANPDGKADNELSVGVPVYDVTILVLSNGSVKRSYAFDKGLVTKWELSGFDAMEGRPVYRSIEITHSGLYEVTA